jgi:hypothetical protein
MRSLRPLFRGLSMLFLSIVILPATAQNCSVAITNTFNPQCNALCNGMATAVGSGTQPFTYSWSPGGQITATATNLCAGSYTVTMTDSTGCQATATVTITQPPPLMSTTSGNASICPGSCAQIVATATGGTQPYTFLWQPSTGLSCTMCSVTTACPTTTTSYTVTVYDGNNCQTTSSTTVTVYPAAMAVACCDSTICQGGSITLNATSNNGPLTWTPATGLSSTTGYSVVASPTVTTTYTATSTTQDGCTDTANVTVTVITCTGMNEAEDASITVSLSGDPSLLHAASR